MKGMNDFTLVPCHCLPQANPARLILLREEFLKTPGSEVQEYNVEAHAKYAKYPRAESGYAGDSLRTAAAATGFDHSGAGGTHHKWEYFRCRSIYRSEDCLAEMISGGSDGKGNPEGVANVRGFMPRCMP